jgi:hypothetical protein
MAAEGGVGVPGAPRSASHWLRACPTSTEPARVARRSSSVPTLTPRSSRRFPLFLRSRSRREDLLPSIQAVSLGAPDASLALASSSIYPSAVSLFVLLSPPFHSFLLSVFLPSPPVSLSLAVSLLSLYANSVRQVLRGFSLSLRPSSSLSFFLVGSHYKTHYRKNSSNRG